MDAKGLGQLGRTVAKFANGHAFPALLHQPDASNRIQRPDQDKPIPRLIVLVIHPTPFHQKVKEPVHPVIEIDVGSSRTVSRHEAPGPLTLPGVAGRVVYRRVGFCLNDDSCCLPHAESASNQLTRTKERVPTEERWPELCHSPVG